MSRGKVAIIGSGLVGTNWATIFSSGGYEVQLFDVNENQLHVALKNVAKNLKLLNENGLNRGSCNDVEALKYVSITLDLQTALENAIYVQESTVENVEFRRVFYQKIDYFLGPETIVASSSSTIPALKFTEHLKNRDRYLIAHPVNPPLYLTLTEVVPAPWTKPEAVRKTVDILKAVGQKPVLLKREIEGFAVNRLQFALLVESWNLIADDVISAEDLDVVMSAGLGPRYAFQGPLETIHLNANGVRDYFNRYANGLRKVTADFKPIPDFRDEGIIGKIEESLEGRKPSNSIAEWQLEREKLLLELAKLKKGLEKN
ncbi:unnamed protein product [Caenorhabditis bovis]|uniref:3-hydroxyacyl-CoA dehydrogenase NAD binding domain-containing protein n=1 Tax=Caenorhabditis bovis TaxID=2654633 RepID=A0A8S1F7Z0_9PELO|nr:unnamed protein product [Caenorhabditis bovis]